jgi:outer membrane protein TolC
MNQFRDCLKDLHSKRFGSQSILGVLGAVIAISLPVGFAQSTPTREQAVQASLETAPVLVAKARVSVAEAQALAANIPISGAVNLGYSWTGTDPRPSVGEATKGDWSYGAQVNFAGLFGEANNTRVMAQIGLERAQLGLSATVLRANRNAINLWHGVRRAKANLEASQIAREIAVLQDKEAELRLQSGAINITERETTHIELETAMLEEQRSKGRLETLQNQLGTLIASGGETAVTAGWQALAGPPESVSFDHREDVFEARAALISSQLDLQRVQRAVLPTLNVDIGIQGSSGGLGLKLNSDLAVGLSYSNPNTNLPSGTTTWNFGLGVRIPVDPIKLQALSTLEQTVMAAQASLKANLLVAKADISAKRAALELTRTALKLSERQLELATQQLEYTKKRVNEGIRPAVELRRSELLTLRARNAVLTAQADVDAAIIDVFEAINTQIPTSLEVK